MGIIVSKTFYTNLNKIIKNKKLIIKLILLYKLKQKILK